MRDVRNELTKRTLPPAATAYVWGLLLFATFLLFTALMLAVNESHDFTTVIWPFIAFTFCAAFTHTYGVRTNKNQTYHLTPAFLFTILLLLGWPWLLISITIVYCVELVRVKSHWFILAFNMSTYIISGALAGGIYETLLKSYLDSQQGISYTIAAAFAAFVFTLTQHLLLALMLQLAHRLSIRQSGLLSVENLATDGALSIFGGLLAKLWYGNPWLIVLALAPIILLQRALEVPALKEEAHSDPKTGLSNAKHFMTVLDEEVRRAKRFERPISVIMLDMDLLREINNAHGHLAGDAVLKAVARILQDQIREYDLAARFGGEEFAVMLLESDAENALIVAERIRKAVEDHWFEIPTEVAPIRARISAGVSSFPVDAVTPEDLLHQADLALYLAKLSGRNKCFIACDDSRALSMDIGREKRVPFIAKSLESLIQRDDSLENTPSESEFIEAPQSNFEVQFTTPKEDILTPAKVQQVLDQEELKPAKFSVPSWSLPSYLVIVISVAVMLILYTFPAILSWNWNIWIDISILTILAVLLNNVSLDNYSHSDAITVSIVADIAAVLIGGAPGIVIVETLAAFWFGILSKSKLYKILFNVSNLTLSCISTGFIITYITQIVSGHWYSIFVDIIVAGLAGIILHAVNNGLLAFAISFSEQQSPISIWKEQGEWSRPHYVALTLLAYIMSLATKSMGPFGLIAFIVPALVMQFSMKQYLDNTVENVTKLKVVNSELENEHNKVVESLKQLKNAYDGVLRALSAALDTRDTETFGHSERVVLYTQAMARVIGIKGEDLEIISQGALLHDIGKIGVPDAILRKPGKLTPEEWRIMRKHPEFGHQIVTDIPFLHDAGEVILHHHERYDGSGYPHKLIGKTIPLGARIFAVADTFDAMTSNRPYRQGMDPVQALEEIIRESGTQFDPIVVQAFTSIFESEILPVLKRAKKQQEKSVLAG